MQRTTAPGATAGNRYTEGDPTLGVPATVVSAEAANFWQEEIINLMVAAGVAQSSNETDLRDAVIALIGGGGSSFSTQQSISNNSTSNLTALVFDKADIKAVRVFYNISRITDTQEVDETGELFVYHKTDADTWSATKNFVGDDSGVTFAVDSNGQVSYTSDDLTGTSYVGLIRIQEILTIKQAAS